MNTGEQWTARKAINADKWVIVSGQERGVIMAECYTQKTAQAVSALPELYEALLGLIVCKDNGEVPGAADWDIAYRALAKARGN